MLHEISGYERYPESGPGGHLDSAADQIETDLTVVGYAHACIGSALSLIKKGQNIDNSLFGESNTILSERNGYIFWSATDTSEYSNLSGRAITFAYKLEDGIIPDVQTLSRLWITVPGINKKHVCFMVVRDDEGTPSAYRYTTRKGWHIPKERQIKKIFHDGMLPLDKSESICPRRELFKEHDYENFDEAMQKFEQYQKETG